ncbi:MAG: hypothetical protein J7K72_00520 [Candidatus Aenigmarchaeota archaeon]|nr:hypothetical protein [Candidatus Aenigmarchaeota archaeon]
MSDTPDHIKHNLDLIFENIEKYSTEKNVRIVAVTKNRSPGKFSPQ